MSTITVKNGNVDGALKTFKQKNAKEGLLKEIRKHEHYEKPGLKKRNAKKEAIKNARRVKKEY